MYWRRRCGVTRRDRITNEEIRRRMNDKDNVSYIEEKRLLCKRNGGRVSYRMKPSRKKKREVHDEMMWIMIIKKETSRTENRKTKKDGEYG